MIRISKTFTFEAAHHLPNVPEGHQCARVHGHSYVVEVEVAGPVDPVAGWVMDFAAISAAWKATGGLLDHTDLNEWLNNPTAENLAGYLAAALQGILGEELQAVAVHETASSKAVWSL